MLCFANLISQYQTVINHEKLEKYFIYNGKKRLLVHLNFLSCISWDLIDQKKLYSLFIIFKLQEDWILLWRYTRILVRYWGSVLGTQSSKDIVFTHYRERKFKNRYIFQENCFCRNIDFSIITINQGCLFAVYVNCYIVKLSWCAFYWKQIMRMNLLFWQ